MFRQYLNRCKGKVILIRGTESYFGYIVPYSTRFDGDYRLRVRKALRGVHISKGTLLTLTTDPKRFNDIDETTRALKKGWNRLLVSFKTRFGAVSYLTTLEFGKEHNIPHMHIIIKKSNFQKKIRSGCRSSGINM